jgi:hypothetical protein
VGLNGLSFAKQMFGDERLFEKSMSLYRQLVTEGSE